MAVLELLRAELAARRATGETFNAAWPAACERALAGTNRFDQGTWAAALSETRPTWRAAYEHGPCQPGTLAVVQLRDELYA